MKSIGEIKNKLANLNEVDHQESYRAIKRV